MMEKKNNCRNSGDKDAGQKPGSITEEAVEDVLLGWGRGDEEEVKEK